MSATTTSARTAPTAPGDDLAATRTGSARVRRTAVVLAVATIAWNVVEATVALRLGLAGGSVALLGFGLDATIEVAAAAVALAVARRGGVLELGECEAGHQRLIAAAFGVLAVVVGWQSVAALASGIGPELGTAAFVLTAAALVSSSALAVAKTRVARRLGSPTLVAEARQTWLCAGQSAALLVGFGATVALGWWWTDGLLGLGLAAVAASEAYSGLRPQ